jgi:hypothetical protein
VSQNSRRFITVCTSNAEDGMAFALLFASSYFSTITPQGEAGS